MGVVDEVGVRQPGLKDYVWLYIKSRTPQELEVNRAKLCSNLRIEDCAYIKDTWVPKERRVIHLYTTMYANLSSTLSQRVESYHPVIRQVTNR